MVKDNRELVYFTFCRKLLHFVENCQFMFHFILFKWHSACYGRYKVRGTSGFCLYMIELFVFGWLQLSRLLLLVLCIVLFLFITFVLTHICLTSHERDIGKQCRPRSDAAERGVWSRSTLFALRTGIFVEQGNN